MDAYHMILPYECDCPLPIVSSPDTHYESCWFGGQLYFAYSVLEGGTRNYYGGKIINYTTGGNRRIFVTNNYRILQEGNVLVNAQLSSVDTGDTSGGVDSENYTDPIDISATQSAIIGEIESFMEWDNPDYDYYTNDTSRYIVKDPSLPATQLSLIVEMNYVRARWEVPDDFDFVRSERSYYKIEYSTAKRDSLFAPLSAWTIVDTSEFVWTGGGASPYTAWIEFPMEQNKYHEFVNCYCWSYRWTRGGVPKTILYNFPYLG